MMDCFENYDQRRGLWFWLMLSLASVISNDPELSAKKTDYLVKDFIESDFYTEIINANTGKRLLWAK